MKLNIEHSAVIITPTIGSSTIQKCVDSVANQTYSNLEHLLVLDGNNVNIPDWEEGEYEGLKTLILPYNTGGNGFYGHRIYAAIPHLVNHDYILFLDEDNWFEPDHVKTLIGRIEENRWDWGYSLRNIYEKDETFVAQDNCESLGKWPIFWSAENDDSQKQYLIDTSSYCFRRQWLINYCHHWHYGWGGDRRFYHIIKNVVQHTNYGVSGKHTLNYRLDDAIEKKYGSLDFFKAGNELMNKLYGGFPWTQ